LSRCKSKSEAGSEEAPLKLAHKNQQLRGAVKRFKLAPVFLCLLVPGLGLTTALEMTSATNTAPCIPDANAAAIEQAACPRR
jgi:hypothetical protein